MPICFEAMIAEINKSPQLKVNRDLSHCLDVTPTYVGGCYHEYNVRVPNGYEDGIDESELITRCDNRGDAIDLTKPAGKKCHFGGNVKWSDTHNAKVTVWVD